MRQSHIAGFAATLFAALATNPAFAQSVLLLDTAHRHGAQEATRPQAAFPLDTGVPADWAAPVDYATGTVHFRLEILDKPTGTAIRYQPCLERSALRACAPAQLLSDSGATRAVYTWSQPLVQWTPAGMGWTTRPDRLVLLLQDAYGRPVAPSADNWVGQPFLSLYYPMRVRFSAALTALGAAFPGWPDLIPTGLAAGRDAPPAAPRGPRLVRDEGRGPRVLAVRPGRDGGETDVRDPLGRRAGEAYRFP
jgi:hypothetical protein